MSIRTISEDGRDDFEIWTCDTCGHEIVLQGIGGDVCECPECMRAEYAAEVERHIEKLEAEKDEVNQK